MPPPPPGGAPAYGNPSHLLPPTLEPLITTWLTEDAPAFDIGGFVVGESPAEARLLCKSQGVLAGVPFFNETFRVLGCEVEWLVKEGELISGGGKKHVATVRGPARKILLGERVGLNVLARCSGIATQSKHLLTLLRSAGYPNTLAGTRKTTPGFRIAEKYAMLVGGCDPHRHSLSTMTMLKDNHIWAHSAHSSSSSSSASATTTAAAITASIQAARAAGGFSVKIEVECQTLEEAHTAAEAGADVVMLDNFSADEVRTAARSLKERWGEKVLVEVSGGLTEENAERYACEDVDVISSSSIHQGVRHVDFSLKVVQKGIGSGGVDGAGESVQV
ncbi:MAG: hypothetical protein M1822_005841 [Bathelium mastoideum]|nr:MAG: hypothetical protein M1822_005841 [Bathelium mastoideum]